MMIGDCNCMYINVSQGLRILYIIEIFKELTDDEQSLTLDQLNDNLLSYNILVERKTLHKEQP